MIIVPTIIGTPTYNSSPSQSNLVVTTPSGLQDGDYLVAAVRAQIEGVTDATATGWDRIGVPFVTGTTGRISGFFGRAVTNAASEPSSHTFTLPVATRGVVAMFIVRGVDLDNPVSGSSPASAAGYRGTWVGDITGGRVALAFPIINPSLVLQFAGNECVDGVSHIPEVMPSGYATVINIETGTGTTGSRTALWVGQQDIYDVSTLDALTHWGAPSGEASQGLALRGISDAGGGWNANDGSGAAVTVYYTDASGDPKTPQAVSKMRPGFKTVSDMLATPGFTIGHRGNSIRYAEESLRAYTLTVARNYGALECSFGRTSDGVWVAVHDNDINRTSQTTGLPAIKDMTWAQVQQHQITNSGDGIPQPYMRWEELRDTYGSTHVLMLDPKNYNWGTHLVEFMAMCNELGPTRVIVKQYMTDTNLATVAGAAGFQTWGYAYEDLVSDPNFDDLAQPWTLLGMDLQASNEAWTATLAKGKPVIGHIAASQAEYDIAMSKGSIGVQVSGSHLVSAVGPYAS